MKIYSLIHEQDTDSAWGSDVKLFLDKSKAQAEMRNRWDAALDAWEIDKGSEQSDDWCWEFSGDSAYIRDGSDCEKWRVEEHDLDVNVAIEVRGGMVTSVISNAGVDVDVYDLDVSDFPDDGEEDEADRKEREFTELSNRPDWGSVW